MEKKICHTSGTLQFQQLTSEYLEDVLNFINTSFFPHENVCQVVGIAKDPEALQELKELTRTAALDGVTVVAIDTTNNKIVGAAINKIQTRDNSVFENFAKTWKTAKARRVVEFMAEFDDLCNLFDYCKIDCLFELMFLGTSPEYRGRGIGKKLSEMSLEIATNLANGNNVKLSINNEKLGLEARPKVISSILTSIITQKIIGRHLGFEVVAEKRFEDLDFHGLDFSSVIKSGTTKITLEYKRL